MKKLEYRSRWRNKRALENRLVARGSLLLAGIYDSGAQLAQQMNILAGDGNASKKVDKKIESWRQIGNARSTIHPSEPPVPIIRYCSCEWG